MKAELVSSLAEVGKSEWDSLNASEHPFTSYDFLNSLEVSHSVSSKTGWNPKHIVVKNEKGNIIGVSPNYLKMHSYGEYIFDHAWANAFENAGGQYYPKVLSAIPFTPATGPRVLINPNNPDKDKIFELIINMFEMIVQNNNLSSAHLNFITDNLNKKLKSSKRKAIKKERKTILNNNLVIQKVTGNDLNDKIWDSFYDFYLNTIDKKWGGAYLTKNFFYLINKTMKNNILLIIAKQDNKIVAGALNFISKNTLYGRNWGSIVDIPFLHFELCYYQAIEYAIEHNIKTVEAGAQGHHKIQRGYVAELTYSSHFIQNESFAKAVRNFVQLEAMEIDKQIELINQQGSPYSNI